MAINDKFLEPLKEEHQVLVGEHQKPTESSDYHFHNYVATTNFNNGKMLYADNKTNFPLAQRLADITQQEVLLQIGEDIQIDANNVKKAYRKVFKPHKNKE